MQHYQPLNHLHGLYLLLFFFLICICRWTSSKEIKKSPIQEMKIQAIEAICLIERAFLASIMESQLQLIMHLAKEVAYVGTLHSRWMFS